MIVGARGRFAASTGNPGHQWQAWKIVAGKKTLAGQIAVGVEVAVLAVAGFQKQVELLLGIICASFGTLAFLFGDGVAARDAVGHLELLLCCLEQGAPALECPGKRLGSICDDILYVVRCEPCTVIQLSSQLFNDPCGSDLRARLCVRRPQCCHELRFGWFFWRVHVEQLGNAVVQRVSCTRQPDCLQVALHQIAVGQIQGGSPYHAMHHVLCPVEEPLIVWAQRRAIGDNQRLLAGAPGTATALRVVCRCWGDVTQVYRVERRNVHAQLHGGRAEHQGQPFKWRPVVGLPFVLVFLAVSKALLENLSGLGVDLCRVFLCLEFEQRVRDGFQQFGRALVECTEVGICLTWLLFGQGRCQAPIYERCVETPAEQVLLDG